MSDTTTQQNTFNGWSNRETWLVGLHDFFDHEQVLELIDESVNDYLNSDASLSTSYILSRKLKDIHDEYIDAETAHNSLSIYVKDFIADHQINWHEIARHYDKEIDNILHEELTNYPERAKQFVDRHSNKGHN